MNADNTLLKGIVVFTLSLGFALGAAGILLIEHFTSRRRRIAIEHDVSRLTTDVTELRYQIQQIRSGHGLKTKKNTKPPSRSAQSVSSEADSTDANAFDTADEEDEFFDVSDGEFDPEDPLSKLLHDVDALLRGSPEEQQSAFYLLEQEYPQYPESEELLWRLAKASNALVAALGDTITTEQKKALIQKGCEYGEKALKLNPQSHEAHKWYAINVGSRGELSGMNDKVSDGLLFIKHVELALSLKPDDSLLHHLKGRFYFEIATLPWVQRSLASTLFSMPSASVDDALQHFLTAEELTKTPWKENCIFIARCYESIGKVDSTIRWLQKALVVDCVSAGDEAAEKELQGLMSKYRSHLQENS